MKKIFIAFALFLLTSIFAPSDAFAQCNPATGVNCFHCTWTGIECVVDISTYNCRPGFDSSPQICSSQTNMGDCQGQINNSCIATSPPEETCFECVDTITGCIPRELGDPRCEYLNAATCDAACKGQSERYRCENNICIADPSGPYDGYVDCEAGCVKGLPPISPEEKFPTCSVNGKEGIDTAIGCIPIEDSNALIGFILKWAIGVGGGIAFLLIVLAGFQIMTSAGNPDRLKAGQELMTSAIAGLILLIFSVFILRIIGVDILGLPGFGES
jgi:hypothetical protein